MMRIFLARQRDAIDKILPPEAGSWYRPGNPMWVPMYANVSIKADRESIRFEYVHEYDEPDDPSHYESKRREPLDRHGFAGWEAFVSPVGILCGISRPVDDRRPVWTAVEAMAAKYNDSAAIAHLNIVRIVLRWTEDTIGTLGIVPAQ